jgi:hypothetical protein
MSPALPALTVLMVWIDRLGHDWAFAPEAPASKAAPTPAPTSMRNNTI